MLAFVLAGRNLAAPGVRRMKPSCKSAAEALAEGPLAGLIQQARLLAQVQAAVEAVSRELTKSGAVLPSPHYAIQRNVVIITVGSPSHAAKLRQQASRITQTVRECVPEVTAIQIRLQLGVSSYPKPVTASSQALPTPAETRQTPRDPAAAMPFATDLAENLRDSPLRDSARRLQTTLQTRLAGRRQASNRRSGDN